MRFIINLLITAAVVYFLAKEVPPITKAGLLEPHVLIDTFNTALIFSLVLALLNMLIKPLLVILTLPITIITLGLFLLIINAAIILLADKFVSGIKVDGWLWALIFSLILSLLTSILQGLTSKSKN